MKLVITINTETPAFGDYPEGEAARILQRLVLDMRGMSFGYLQRFPLRDSKGNTVGNLELVP